jgi:arylsulfatase A-like enzyme
MKTDQTLSPKTTFSKLLLFGLLLCFLFLGCSQEPANEQEEPQKSSLIPLKKDWNVLIVMIDALRADHISANGYQRETSPFLDSLISQGIYFEDAVALAPWTVPSVLSLLASLPPRAMINEEGTYDLHLAPAALPEYLLEQGYNTAGFTTNRLLLKEYGYDRGFEYFVENNEFRLRMKAELLHEQLFPWIANHATSPFFAYAHYMEVHDPYRAPEEYALPFLSPDYKLPEMLHRGEVTPYHKKILAGEPVHISDEKKYEIIALYDACIRQLDDQLKKLDQFLRDKKLREKTIIWVVADHGQELFDHGSVKHGYTLYEEILRIPMLLVYPGGPEGLRIKGQVDLTDVFPTTIELLGGDPFSLPVEGRSLLPLIKGHGKGKEHIISECKVSQRKNRWMFSVRRLTDKWMDNHLDPEQNAFYDLSRDPGEKNPLPLPEELAKDYPSLIENWIERYTPGVHEFVPEEYSPEMREALEALGYIGNSPEEDQQPKETR